MNNSLSVLRSHPASLSAFDPCGIEVSQHTLVVALRVDDHDQPLRQFPNTAAGHQAVLRFLERSGRSLRVALESTGLYGLDLALTLHQARVAVMVANPRAVRHFAQALLERSKNDRLDAQVLRQYAARMPLEPWRPPSAAAFKLVAVARRLEGLTEMMTQEKNRLHAASLSRALPPLIRIDLQRSIAHQQHPMERLTTAALDLVLSDPRLARRYELLGSIPGGRNHQRLAYPGRAHPFPRGHGRPPGGGLRRPRPARVHLGNFGAQEGPHQ